MKVLKLKNREIKTNRPAFVMGIVNVTPDSFWCDSRGGVDHALKLIDEGADILDLGGESTRPGAKYVNESEEVSRLIPVIEGIRKRSDIPISIDTRKSSVMKSCLLSGADICNDISALEDDSEMVNICAQFKIPVILMHKRGTPQTMQCNTVYSDIFDEVNSYLVERALYAEQHGIESDKIILDPGVGFGKDTRGNFNLIRNCGKLASGKYPVLMALSRKTCIGDVTGQTVDKRLSGTLCADILSVIHGASMIRVHDVREAVDTLNVLNAAEYDII